MATRNREDISREDLLARLTTAAYDVALRRQGSFLDLQLDLWAALREVLEEEVPPVEVVPNYEVQIN